MPEQYQHPRFIEAVDYILKTARKNSKEAGIHVTYPVGFQQEISWSMAGANPIVQSVDLIAFGVTMRREIIHIKTVLGDRTLASNENIHI